MNTYLLAQAINTDGITDWVQTNIVPILLVIIGIGILAKSRKGNWSDTMNTSGVAIVGIMFIVAAGAFVTLGSDMAAVIFN